jgi:hypothetical protein
LGISSIIALFLVIGQDPVRTTLQVHSVTAAFLQIVGGLTDLAASMDATFRAASQNATALRLAELQAAYDGLPCNASGYCSLGQTRVWRGDIATNDAMREMLAAVSYRKEVHCQKRAGWIGWVLQAPLLWLPCADHLHCE